MDESTCEERAIDRWMDGGLKRGGRREKEQGRGEGGELIVSRPLAV